MTPQELLTETIETPSIECWNDEGTASALRALAVRLHSTGISLRETAAALESIGIKRSHQAVYQWTHRVGEEAPDPPTASLASIVSTHEGVTGYPAIVAREIGLPMTSNISLSDVGESDRVTLDAARAVVYKGDVGE